MNEKLRAQEKAKAIQTEIVITRNEIESVADVSDFVYIARKLAKISVVLLLCLVLWMSWVYIDNTLLPFDPQSWKAAGKSWETLRDRQRYVGRLRRQYQLVGMSKTEIAQLLGKTKNSQEDLWIYHCGSYPIFNYVFFEIQFKNNRVASHEVRELHD